MRYKSKDTAFNGISYWLHFKTNLKGNINDIMVNFRKNHNDRIPVSKYAQKNAEYCQKYFQDFTNFYKENIIKK